jgi:hypothetical protein
MKRHVLRTSWVTMAVALAMAESSALASGATTITCDAQAADNAVIDGIVDTTDEWVAVTAAGKGNGNSDADVTLRCAWDGKRLIIAAVVTDDRIVRLPKASANEDSLMISLAANNGSVAPSKPLIVTVWPGNAIAKRRQTVSSKSKKMQVADSLTPHGFSLELAVDAKSIPGLSAATVGLQLGVRYQDADAASGAAPTEGVTMERTIELSDRSQLFDDLLTTVRLRKADIVFDQFADLDSELPGKERVLMGGVVVGVLTSQFAFVNLPAANPKDILSRGTLPLGKPGHHVIYAVVRQKFDTGSRDLLLLFTVWSGQLQPLGSFEIRKQIASNIFETTYQASKGKAGTTELTLTAKPAIGFTQDNYQPSTEPDVDAIMLPWDLSRSSMVVSLQGMELSRRDVASKGVKSK